MVSRRRGGCWMCNRARTKKYRSAVWGDDFSRPASAPGSAAELPRILVGHCFVHGAVGRLRKGNALLIRLTFVRQDPALATTLLDQNPHVVRMLATGRWKDC